MGYIEEILPAGHPQGENPPRLYISDEDMEQFEQGEVSLLTLKDRHNTGQRDEFGQLLNEADFWDGDDSWNK